MGIWPQAQRNSLIRRRYLASCLAGRGATAALSEKVRLRHVRLQPSRAVLEALPRSIHDLDHELAKRPDYRPLSTSADLLQTQASVCGLITLRNDAGALGCPRPANPPPFRLAAATEPRITRCA
jgi:hypothetical protein